MLLQACGSLLPGSGAVWRQGALYYVNTSFWLTRYDLATGVSEQLAQVPFTGRPSPDGAYSSGADAIGMYLDEDTGELVMVSRNDPGREGEFLRLRVAEPSFTGALETDGFHYRAACLPGEASIVLAGYDSRGKMLGAAVDSAGRYGIVPLPAAACSYYRAFLVDRTALAPLAPALTMPPPA